MLNFFSISNRLLSTVFSASFDEGHTNNFSRCFVSVTMGDSSFTLKSNGIPDHNACAAPPRSTVLGMKI